MCALEITAPSLSVLFIHSPPSSLTYFQRAVCFSGKELLKAGLHDSGVCFSDFRVYQNRLDEPVKKRTLPADSESPTFGETIF